MPRALGRESDAREALLGELRAAAGEPALAPMAAEAERLLFGAIPEASARHAIERLALCLAAATLARFGDAAVSDGFAARRLHGASLTLGAGERAIDETAILARLALQG
ncbi:MAG TPA: hypothetical protein VMU93_03095 [Caulobacteraceae bacterium]|nr:hypothetical protein [Caulobacteraceae bacterium]